MKRRISWGFVIFAAIASLGALAAMLFAFGATPAYAAKDKENSFSTRHILSQPELTQLAELLRQHPWQVPVDFSAELFQQGDAKPIDAPVGLADYKTLPLLLDWWDINPIPVVPGSTWAGVKLDYDVKPLGQLTSAEQRNVMLRYRAPGWTSDRSLYTATTQLRYIGLMAWCEKSELFSLEDILATEYTFGPWTVKGQLSYIDKMKGSLSPDDFAAKMREEVGITYTSWVTGKCFEPWHAEFSPGNGIIREITDPAEREKLHAAAMEIEKTKANQHAYGFLKAHPDSVAYFIAQLYGEKQTIWQNVVWTIRDYKEYAEPLEEEVAFAIPKIVEKLKQNTMTEEDAAKVSTLDWLLPKTTPGDQDITEVEGYKRYADTITVLQHGEFAETVKELDDPDMPLDDEIVPYGMLTDSEKTALGSDLNGRVVLAQKLYQIVEADLPAISGWEDIASEVLTTMRPGMGPPLEEQINDDLRKYFYDGWLSPITRKTIELWHKEWSRGNGYIKRIDDEATVKKLRELYVDYAKAKAGNGYYGVPDKKKILKYQFYYVRLYGDKPGSIIAEGIWSVEKLN